MYVIQVYWELVPVWVVQQEESVEDYQVEFYRFGLGLVLSVVCHQDSHQPCVNADGKGEVSHQQPQPNEPKYPEVMNPQLEQPQIKHK